MSILSRCRDREKLRQALHYDGTKGQPVSLITLCALNPFKLKYEGEPIIIKMDIPKIREAISIDVDDRLPLLVTDIFIPEICINTRYTFLNLYECTNLKVELKGIRRVYKEFKTESIRIISRDVEVVIRCDDDSLPSFNKEVLAIELSEYVFLKLYEAKADITFIRLQLPRPESITFDFKLSHRELCISFEIDEELPNLYALESTDNLDKIQNGDKPEDGEEDIVFE